MRIYVDEIARGLTQDFDLDPNQDCGDGLGPDGIKRCWDMGHSLGMLTVPQGNHTVKVEYAGKEFINDTDVVDWGGDTTRKFVWKKDACAP
jgi:hypothetical protein